MASNINMMIYYINFLNFFDLLCCTIMVSILPISIIYTIWNNLYSWESLIPFSVHIMNIIYRTIEIIKYMKDEKDDNKILNTYISTYTFDIVLCYIISYYEPNSILYRMVMEYYVGFIYGNHIISTFINNYMSIPLVISSEILFSIIVFVYEIVKSFFIIQYCFMLFESIHFIHIIGILCTMIYTIPWMYVDSDMCRAIFIQCCIVLYIYVGVISWNIIKNFLNYMLL